MISPEFYYVPVVLSISAETNSDIEEFFLDTTAQEIRRYFPPSFAFTEFDVNGKLR